MPLDLPTAVPLLVSVLGALGIASIISQWFAAGKDRRAAGGAVLTELRVIETARWADPREDIDAQYRQLRAIRQLLTAVLIAQAPRRPIVLYSQFPLAAFRYTRGEIEKVKGDLDLIGLPTGFYHTVYGQILRDLSDRFGPFTRRLDSAPTELRRVRSGHEDILPGGEARPGRESGLPGEAQSAELSVPGRRRVCRGAA